MAAVYQCTEGDKLLYWLLDPGDGTMNRRWILGLSGLLTVSQLPSARAAMGDGFQPDGLITTPVKDTRRAAAPWSATELWSMGPERQVARIQLTAETYYITVVSGETLRFHESLLRFKSDTSLNGPAPGIPVVLPLGSVGDRAQVVFAHPKEMTTFITA